MNETPLWGQRNRRRHTREIASAEMNVALAEKKMTDYRKLNAELQLEN